MLDKVDKYILDTRLAKLTVALDETVHRTEVGSDLWYTLNMMQTILAEEYEIFKENNGSVI